MNELNTIIKKHLNKAMKKSKTNTSKKKCNKIQMPQEEK